MNTNIYKRFLMIVILLLAGFIVVSQPLLPEIFSSNMVLQRGMPVPVWGTASPNKNVTVSLASGKATAKTDAKGNWKITLPAMSAGGPFTLTIESENKKQHFQNILVGDVWVCSGQSNMEFSLRQEEHFKKEINEASHPNIRLFKMEKDINPTKRKLTADEITRLKNNDYYQPASWKICDSATVKDFSAVAYYFAKYLQQDVDVPIGLIQNAIGGSPTEAWIRKEAFASNPQLKMYATSPPDSSFLNRKYGHPFTIERIMENLEPLPLKEKKADGYYHHPFSPSYLYDTGIEPLLHTPIKGVLWYQGESNATYPDLHKQLFELLINSWRKAWKQSDFPFLYVQLPGIGPRNRWPEFREGQQELLSTVPNTGMAVTIDVGDASDVHPKNKKTVGERLSRIALAKWYGKNVEYSGPVLANYEKNDSTIILHFTHAAGLKTNNAKPVAGFALQGYVNNGKTEEVISVRDAVINNETISIKIPKNFSVTKIKYAWAPFPETNLVNDAALPAAPFKIELQGSF